MSLSSGTLVTLGLVGVVAAGGAWSKRGSRSLAPASAEALQGLLAILRAMQIAIHEGHWVVQGSSQYGDHLLLQRIYAGGEGSPVLQDEIDSLGERIVAYAGPSFVNSVTVTEKSLMLLRTWRRGAAYPMRQALHAEESLQLAIREVYDALRAAGDLSLGLDDLLMGMANAHDTNRYLLRQRLDDVLRGSAARTTDRRDLSVRAFHTRHPGTSR